MIERLISGLRAGLETVLETARAAADMSGQSATGREAIIDLAIIRSTSTHRLPYTQAQ